MSRLDVVESEGIHSALGLSLTYRGSLPPQLGLTIDGYVERVPLVMGKRAGHIPTCDHHVPLDVSYESYLYHRRRFCELDCST